MQNQISKTDTVTKPYKPSVILFIFFGFISSVLSIGLAFLLQIPSGGADNLYVVFALLIMFLFLAVFFLIPAKFFFRMTFKETLWRFLFFFLGFVGLPVAAGIFLSAITLT